MNPVIQEYIDLVYDRYDSIDLTVPTALGINKYFFNKLIKELSTTKQTVLFLLPNVVTETQTYMHFCTLVNYPPEHNRTSYYEFDNGSLISFKSHNTLYKHNECDVVIISDLYMNLDKLRTKFIEKIMSIDKKITLNCTLGDYKKVMFNEESYISRIKNITTLDNIKNDIRRIKLEKIIEKCKVEI